MSQDASRSNRDHGWQMLPIVIAARTEATVNRIERKLDQHIIQAITDRHPRQPSFMSRATNIGIKVAIGRILTWVLYLGTPIMLWMTAWAWHRIGPWWRFLLGAG